MFSSWIHLKLILLIRSEISSTSLLDSLLDDVDSSFDILLLLFDFGRAWPIFWIFFCERRTDHVVETVRDLYVRCRSNSTILLADDELSSVDILFTFFIEEGRAEFFAWHFFCEWRTESYKFSKVVNSFIMVSLALQTTQKFQQKIDDL